MRDHILAAVLSGEVEELRVALEWNELRPDLGIAPDEDAIAHWRKISGDGEGREILAMLGGILAGPPARLPIGPDIENKDVYVWPYLAEVPPSRYTGRDIVELYRTLPPAEATRILKSGKWSWYRLAIGADGVWHTFSRPAE